MLAYSAGFVSAPDILLLPNREVPNRWFAMPQAANSPRMNLSDLVVAIVVNPALAGSRQ